MLVSFIFLVSAHMAQAGVFNGGGWPNPDAYCEANGGRLVVMQKNALGDEHYCQLGTALIESFTLLASSDPDNAKIEAPRTAGKVFLSHPAPVASAPGMQPANAYCQQVGGQVKSLQDAAGKSFEICTFSDATAIETSTLFLGPSDKSNAQLTTLLKRLDASAVLRASKRALARFSEAAQKTCYEVTLAPGAWNSGEMLCIDNSPAADGSFLMTMGKGTQEFIQLRYPLLVNDKLKDGTVIRIFGLTDDVSATFSQFFVRFEGSVQADGTEVGTLVFAGQTFGYRTPARN